MSGFKSLTCLLFVALLSVTVQAGALIGHHSTLHRHMKRGDLKECIQDLASQTFKNNNHSSLRAAICYRTDKLFHVEKRTKDDFQTAKLGTCSKKGWLGIRSSYVFRCYYLLGSNKFTATSDGGYDNIALKYVGGKCNWDAGKKELSCHD